MIRLRLRRRRRLRLRLRRRRRRRLRLVPYGTAYCTVLRAVYTIYTVCVHYVQCVLMHVCTHVPNTKYTKYIPNIDKYCQLLTRTVTFQERMSFFIRRIWAVGD